MMRTDAQENEVYMLKICTVTTERNLLDSKKYVEHFSCEGQSLDSFQDTARFAGTKEDALHPAVLLIEREARSSRALPCSTPS